jgi:hypothetical protein
MGVKKPDKPAHKLIHTVPSGSKRFQAVSHNYNVN